MKIRRSASFGLGYVYFPLYVFSISMLYLCLRIQNGRRERKKTNGKKTSVCNVIISKSIDTFSVVNQQRQWHRPTAGSTFSLTRPHAIHIFRYYISIRIYNCIEQCVHVFTKKKKNDNERKQRQKNVYFQYKNCIYGFPRARVTTIIWKEKKRAATAMAKNSSWIIKNKSMKYRNEYSKTNLNLCRKKNFDDTCSTPLHWAWSIV